MIVEFYLNLLTFSVSLKLLIFNKIDSDKLVVGSHGPGNKYFLYMQMTLGFASAHALKALIFRVKRSDNHND